ncbi:cryptochrome/photolyase family protein [Mucilaginibacter sp.]
MSNTLRLVLGDQLNLNHSWYKTQNPHITYVLMEVMQEQEYVLHHVQKILAFFGAMRNFAHQLKKAGHEVIYIALDDEQNAQDFERNLQRIIKEQHTDKFEYQLPDEYRLDEQLKDICRRLGVETSVADTEHFLTYRDDVKNFFGGKNSYLMESFYRHMRKQTGILMQGDDPIGKRWNYDADNRKKYDGAVPLVPPLSYNHDVSALKQMIDRMGVKYFGTVDETSLEWPLSRREAVSSLEYFCEHLLPHFGTCEDAMLQQHISLYHSRMSFALNSKQITPAEVIGKVVEHWQQHQKDISIAQVEGYVRQVMGWREFMRGVYWAQMPGLEQKNFFKHENKVPHWYWDGQTKMNCLQKCIGQSLNHAWAHHIQRLMVIGNFSLIAGLHPDGVDEWYLGVYVDALQWVEITNTRSMSQFADGGLIASKPYASTAAYINKMSDYCKHCHYDYKKRHGDRACPFNSLYWNFLDRNAQHLKGNPRIGMAYKHLGNMTRQELEAVNEQAAVYIDDLENL